MLAKEELMENAREDCDIKDILYDIPSIKAAHVVRFYSRMVTMLFYLFISSVTLVQIWFKRG